MRVIEYEQQKSFFLSDQALSMKNRNAIQLCAYDDFRYSVVFLPSLPEKTRL